MIFQNTSPEKQLQDNIVINIIFVVAQASRNRASVSFSQIDDAVVSALAPQGDIERNRIRRTIYDVLAKKVLVHRGLASYSKARSEGGAEIMNITQRGMAMLGRRCADIIPMPDLSEEITASSDAPRISERDLVLPALATVVKVHEETGLPVDMTTLREGVKRMLNISIEDLDPLDGRRDTKIDQVIRNLRSHKTLAKEGLVHNTEDGYVPSERGYARLAEEYLSFLPSPDFSREPMQEELSVAETHGVQETVVRPRMRHR